jgi:Zn-dependent protease
MLSGSGVTRLFQISGITVFVHWSWLLVALFEVGGRSGTYSSFAWNLLEYLALFAIVTMHEFGHAVACRSVGGRANEILLWPFGGVAFVAPPPLPGATLWSIAAGPLVNVALAPILGGLTLLIPGDAWPNIHAFFRSLSFINLGLLVFNLLPVYPLDGGQILGSLLWFLLGRARSMLVTASIGLIGVIGIGWLALRTSSIWLAFIAVYVASRCRDSVRLARSLNSMDSGPRRTGVACPSCHKAAPIGPHWRCDSCGAAFDVFDPAAGTAPEPAAITTLGLAGGTAAPAPMEADGLRCPVCHADATTVRCPQCHAVAPIGDWNPSAVFATAPSAVPGVTRLRPPRIPAVAPMVLGACAAIAALVALFVAVAAYTSSARTGDAAAALFMRTMALALSVLALVPLVASILFFVRYGRSRTAFNLAVQRFQAEHNAGVSLTTPQASGAA